MYRVIMEGIVAGGLGILAIIDVRTKEVPQSVVLVMLAMGVGLCFWDGRFWEWSGLMGLAPGGICLLLSFVTKEAIGYGDSIIVLMLGAYWRASQVITICCYALFIAAIVSLILILLKKKDKKDEIPFVPFLFMGNMLCIVFERMEA